MEGIPRLIRNSLKLETETLTPQLVSAAVVPNNWPQAIAICRWSPDHRLQWKKIRRLGARNRRPKVLKVRRGVAAIPADNGAAAIVFGGGDHLSRVKRTIPLFPGRLRPAAHESLLAAARVASIQSTRPVSKGPAPNARPSVERIRPYRHHKDGSSSQLQLGGYADP
jgi:hypothetical protein